jgi:hypothetical protein
VWFNDQRKGYTDGMCGDQPEESGDMGTVLYEIIKGRCGHGDGTRKKNSTGRIIYFTKGY